MLESLKVSGFRKYRELSMDSFQRINFILGNNNVGKTSVLEAIYAWACGQNVIPFFSVPLARGRYHQIQQPYWLMEEILSVVNDRYSLPLSMSFEGMENGDLVRFKHTIYPSELLKEYDVSYKSFSDGIVLKTNEGLTNVNLIGGGALPVPFQLVPSSVIAKWNVEFEGKEKEYFFTAPMTQVSDVRPYKMAKFVDVLSHTMVAENVQVYASLKREKRLQEVVDEIKKIYPEVTGFDMIPYPDGSQSPVSVIKNDGSMLPIYACGDGIQRWFYILGIIALYKNSIICIDEIDSGFHPSAQNSFSENLVRYAFMNDVQLFITTHNIEFLDHFLEAVDKFSDEEICAIRIMTLREKNGESAIRSLDIETAKKAREDFKLELR